MSICGNMVGGAAPLKTLIIQDENGAELVGTVVGEEVVFTAQASDIKTGKIAATDGGITVGTDTRTYHTTESTQVIPNGSAVKISTLKDFDRYNFTKMQAIICDFNTSLSNSVSACKISVNENVYDVQSTTSLSVLVKNDEEKTVDFGIVNNTGKLQILRFMTYKEII